MLFAGKPRLVLRDPLTLRHVLALPVSAARAANNRSRSLLQALLSVLSLTRRELLVDAAHHAPHPTITPSSPLAHRTLPSLIFSISACHLHVTLV